MTAIKQVNFKLTRFNVIFGLLLLLEISWLPASQAQPPLNALVNDELIQKLSNRNLNFSFHIYKLMADQEDAKLSPFSISVALTMTSFGARSNTLKEVNEALDLNGFQDHRQIAKAYNSILKSLDLKGDVNLKISNRIIIDKSYDIKKPFKDIVTNEFCSVAQSVNFLEDGQTLNKEISAGLDQWAQNKFKNLSFLGNDEKLMGAVLVSAIYFKGKWAQQFRMENTKPEEFQLAYKTTQMVPMMNTVAQFYYAEDTDLRSKVLQMEYSGSRLVTYFILPNKLEELQVVRESLTCEWFHSIKKKTQLQTVKVKLPKFNSNFMKELSPELKNLHIYDLESQERVDLTGIAEPQVSGSRLYVQKVLYTAYVEMSEAGAEAISGPLAHSGVFKSAQPSEKKKPVEFFANHPFVFIIYDKATNFVLFIGNVDNPSFT